MPTKSKLIGTFDHYTVSEKEYTKDGISKKFFNPKIVLKNVIDLITGEKFETVTFNYGSGFKKFGLITEEIEFSLNVKRNEDGTFSYPSNITKIDKTYQPIPDISNDLISGMIMQHNQKIGRNDTPINQELIDEWKKYGAAK
jgi:hypothetical protein